MPTGPFGQFLWQRLDARKVVLEIAAAHHACRDFEAYFTFRCADRDSLQVRKEGMIFLGGAQVPRAGVWMTSAMAFEWACS